jgi:hypothetical protein
MDTYYFLLALAVVIVAWVTFVLVARHRGAGYSNRRVRCPEKELPASISVFYRETGAGSPQIRNVLTCSLLGDAPVTCGKGCLAQL